MKKLWLVILILVLVSPAMAYDPLCMAEREIEIEEASILYFDNGGELMADLSTVSWNKLTFHDGDKEVGALYLEDPMRFEGNAEESAKIFFDWVIHYVIEEKSK